MAQYSSSFLYTVRRILSVLLRFSFSKKFSEILLWPVSRRLFGRGYSEVVDIGLGAHMRVYGDMEDMVNKTLMFVNDYKPLAWEPATARLVEVLAKDSRCVVDAGSHIGYYPLLVARVSPQAVVYAFEPNPKNYERLIQNISLNSPNNIRPVPAAIGDKNTSLKMFFDFGQSSLVDSRRTHAGEGIVQVHTLDSFLKDEPVKPDLIILDAEGYEPNILQGAQEIINASKPNIVFELNPKALRAAQSSPDELYNFLSQKGYSLFIIQDDYSHSLYVRETKIRIQPYDSALLAGVSFVNVFATIRPNLFGQYIVSGVR